MYAEVARCFDPIPVERKTWSQLKQRYRP